MRKRVLAVITLTMLVMLVIIGVGTRLIVLDKFSDLERDYLVRDVGRFRSALEDDLEGMSRTVRDWADWDETSAFIRGMDPQYPQRNMAPRVFANLEINLMLYMDASGRSLYGKAVDIESGREAPFPAGLREYLAAHKGFLPGSQSGVSGIVLLQSTPLLICMSPVSDNGGKTRAGGFLLMGRLLDSAEILKLSRTVKLSVTIAPLPREAPGRGSTPTQPPAGGLVAIPKDFLEAAEVLSRDRTIFTKRLDRNTMAAYSLLRDLAGEPVLVARIEAPRDIGWEGIRAVAYFTFWLVFVGVSFSAAVLVFLEKAVISRVHDLSADVLTVGTSNDLSLRVSHSGKDEIAYLGAAINGMLEALESSTGELRKIEARNAALLSAVPDMIVRVSRDGTLLDFRPAAEMPFRGISEGHIGMSLRRIHLDFPAVPAEAVEWAMGTAAASCPGEAPSVLDFSMEEDGKRRSLEARAVCGGENETVFFIRDVTAEKNLEEAQRKEIMLKEIHHRVKNNLQVISSLLDLQARASDNRHTAEVLRESRMRLHSMSIIHEKLYRSGDSSGIPVQEYIRDLVSNLRKSFAADPQAIGFRVNTEDLSLDMDVAVPCGLIINELVSNALKYAFPRGRKGEVRIGFQRGEAGRLVLEVGDDGVGLPPEVDVHSPSTLGLRIVNVLAGQLKGSLEASDDGGTTIRVSFPEP